MKSAVFLLHFIRTTKFLAAFSSLFVFVRSFLVAKRCERFVERKRATRRASSRPRQSNFLRSSFWNRLQHSNAFRQPRRRRLFGRNCLCDRVAARAARRLSTARLLGASNNRNADAGR